MEKQLKIAILYRVVTMHVLIYELLDLIQQSKAGDIYTRIPFISRNIARLKQHMHG